MIAPPIPKNERERIKALQRFELLDTPAEPAFDQIARLTAKLLKAPVALVSLIDEDRQWFKAKVGVTVCETSREISFCGHAIDQGEIFVIEDATLDPRFHDNPLVTGDPHIRFYAGAPLRTREGLVLGTLCVLDSRPRGALSAEEKETFRDLSAMVMAHIEARQAVGYLAPVTALSNRFRFLEDVDAFIADPESGGQQVAVIVIDTATPHEHAGLVRALGHTYADAFEIASAQRIQESVPKRVKLYHISLVRFACVLSAAEQPEIDSLIGRLAAALGRPMLCQDIPVTTSVGIGIANYPGDGTGGEELLRAGISAAHDAIAQGKASAHYNATHDQTSRRAFRLLSDLPSALASQDQLHIAYQPKIDLKTRECIGVEALLRWNHPELGPISPGEFIPLAERTALMRPLTQWVIAAAFWQITAWRREGLALRVSINISMIDLEHEDFPQTVSVLLKDYGVRPEWINIEVTESALMGDRAGSCRQLQAIRELGIEIEIDDFGTGQSALSYLKYIPASIVKIDQLFIRSLATDVNDQCMVRSTINLAHELGYRVVAEGIETMDVFDWLSNHGCDIGQGYAISRPLEPEALRAWFEQAEFARMRAPVRFLPETNRIRHSKGSRSLAREMVRYPRHGRP